MTFEESIQIFDERNRTGRIRNRKTGEAGSVSQSVRNALISSTRVALRAATGRSEVDEVDLLAYAETLPDHAYADAEEAGHRRPANAADRVRRYLVVVEGREYKRARSGERYLPEGWRPLYRAGKSLGRSHASRIAALCRAAMAPHDDSPEPVLNPEGLPEDREVVRRWLVEVGYSRSYAGQILRSYRRARESLSAPARRRLPSLEVHVNPHGRNLTALPHLEELLQGSGVTPKDFRSLSALERIELLAPDIHWALSLYLDEGRGHSAEWRKTAIEGVERVLAAAEFAGFPVSGDPLDLYTKTRAVEASDGPNSANPLLRRRYGAQAARTSGEARYLIRDVMDEAARRSFEASPLAAVEPEKVREIPHYTATVQRDFEHYFRMCRLAFAEAERFAPQDWAIMGTVHSDLVAHIKKHNDDPAHRVQGQKDKEQLLEIITLPQVVCLGLPALRAKVLRLRTAYHATLCDHGDLDHPAVRPTRRRYAKLLQEYLIVALLIADGLRVKNYSGARVGIHLLTDPVIDEAGHWVGLESCRTFWRGFDEEEVRLKIRTDELGKERKRRWTILPGIVDLELLFEYLVDFRVDRLMSAGLLDSPEAYSLESDMREWRFALFPSGHARSRARHGRYGKPDSISTTFGRALHRMATQVLGRDLPKWGTPDLRELHRALFSAHVTRLLLATYWGGVRGNWTLACLLTDDTEETLRGSYSRVGAQLVERLSADDWTNPRFFDNQMDRILKGEVIDWEEEYSSLPRTARPEQSV